MPTILCLVLPLTLPESLARCCCQYQTLHSTPSSALAPGAFSSFSSPSPHFPLLLPPPPPTPSPPPPPSWFALTTPLYLAWFVLFSVKGKSEKPSWEWEMEGNILDSSQRGHQPTRTQGLHLGVLPSGSALLEEDRVPIAQPGISTYRKMTAQTGKGISTLKACGRANIPDPNQDLSLRLNHIVCGL